MQARPISCGMCVSVCDVSIGVSVTFVHSVKTNKDIFEFFFIGSHTILDFPYQTGWRYFDRNSPNGGVSRNRDSEPISGCQRCYRLCRQYDAVGTPCRN